MSVGAREHCEYVVTPVARRPLVQEFEIAAKPRNEPGLGDFDFLKVDVVDLDIGDDAGRSDHVRAEPEADIAVDAFRVDPDAGVVPVLIEIVSWLTGIERARRRILDADRLGSAIDERLALIVERFEIGGRSAERIEIPLARRIKRDEFVRGQEVGLLTDRRKLRIVEGIIEINVYETVAVRIDLSAWRDGDVRTEDRIPAERTFEVPGDVKVRRGPVRRAVERAENVVVEEDPVEE